MKLLYLLPLAINGLRITQKNAQHTQKICKDCKYFIPLYNECRKIDETNLVTGDKTYNLAVKMRNDEDLCGKDGFFFEQNYFKIVTEPYYFVKEYSLLLLVILPLIIPFLYCGIMLFNE